MHLHAHRLSTTFQETYTCMLRSVFGGGDKCGSGGDRQPSTCSSSRLTRMALFKVKLQFVKVPSPSLEMVDCSTLQTRRRTSQSQRHTQTHTNNSQSMHACIHSIQHLLSITLSQERTTHHHCHSSQSSIHQPCIDHSVWHSYMHA